ncbi:hypothetical protein [Bacillus phage vB_BanS-Thrax1]|nr:hypothetical protein [Bacillus phage vB_BanS-Thrax1]
MKVLNNSKPDFYNQTVDIQLTVGELLILKTTMGNSNSRKFAEIVDPSHGDFAGKVVKEDLTFMLFNELKDLLEQISKER